jgi:hypothetical protein
VKRETISRWILAVSANPQQVVILSGLHDINGDSGFMIACYCLNDAQLGQIIA